MKPILTRGQSESPPVEPFNNERRARLLERFASVQTSSKRGLLRLRAKRRVWIAVTSGTRVLKRLIDIAGALLLLVLLAPLFGSIALIIQLDSKGPVFFRQTRVGKWGAMFAMIKFRSMYVDANQRKDRLLALNQMAGGITFKMKDDPRITRVGRFIRRASIDELPQLWNVLNGEMSLVGPRPPVPGEVSQYTLSDRRRLEAKPGITCVWQVSGRSDIPFEQQVELDAAYIESQSLWMD